MDKIPFSVYDFFGYLSSGFLVIYTVDYLYNKSALVNNSSSIINIIFFIVVTYILGHLMAHSSKALLEDFFLRKVIKSPEVHMFTKKYFSKFWSSLFPGNFKELPGSTQNRVLERARSAGVDIVSNEISAYRGLFFHCHALVKKDGPTMQRLNTFLNLYGFCRNISVTLLSISALLLVNFLFDMSNTGYCVLSAVSFLSAYGMLLRYLKFFRHYTAEVFMSYAELSL